MGFDQSSMTDWMEPLGWAVLHSLWQVTVVTLIYAVVVAGTRRMVRARQARLRYVVGCSALAMMVAAPIATFVGTLSDRVESRKPQSSVVVESMPAAVVDRPLPRFASRDTAVMSVSDRLQPAVTRPRSYLTWLAIAWLLGVIVAVIRPLLGLHRVYHLKRSACEHPDLASIVEQVARRLGIRRAVRCLGSALTDVPVLIGHFRPVILVPLSLVTGFDSRQLECLLAHELAHVRRHDYLVNLLQVVIETLLFFHPLVWWVSHRVRADREYCADDLALSIAGPTKAYVETLLRLEYQRQPAFPVIAATGGSLINRVERLVEPTVSAQENRGSAVGVIAILVFLALLFGLVLPHSSQQTNSVSRDSETSMPQNDELIAATLAGDLDKVKALIEAGADPNSVDANGMGTLLNFHPEVTRYLLDKGADPDIQRNENILPVLVGVAGFNTECVRLMLEAGANPDIASDHNGETALHHAAAGGDLELANLLLKSGANPNARTKPGMTTYALWRDARARGETPLHRAAAWSSTEMIQLLLDSGADPSVRDANKDTPLSWASWHQRDKSIIDQLAYEGSGVGPDFPPAEIESSMETIQGASQSSSLVDGTAFTIEQLCVACRKGDTATVREIITGQPDLVDADDQHRWRPIFHAAFRQHETIVRMLVEEGADLSAHDGYVLHYAAEVPDNQPIVRLLVENGALEAHTRPTDDLARQLLHAIFLSDASRVARLLERHPLLAVTVDGSGDQPIHHAARNGETEIARHLVEQGADVNARNERGHTVLYCAGGHGQVETVALLLDKGADKQVAFTHDNKTLLQWLAQYPDDERLQKVAKLLAQDHDRKERKSLSYSEIFQAVKDGDSDRVFSMIDSENALLTVADHNQSTPLTRAFAYQHLDIARLLIERGANVFAMNHSDKWPMRSIVEKGGLTKENRNVLLEAAIAAGNCEAEIFHAVWRGDHDRAEAILKENSSLASLRHADPNGPSGFYNALPYCGLTPLHYAVIAGDKEMVKLLLNAGAEVDAVCHAQEPDSRHTPMYLVPEGCGDIAQLLVDHGADVNHSTLYLSEGSQAMREVIIGNGAGGSPLLRALALGKLDEAAAIIRDDPSVVHDRLHGAAIDTPLHMAAKADSVEIAALLLDQGMDVDTQSSRGRTALVTAAEVYASFDMFKLLVQRGADIHFNNDFPLKAAIWQHAYGHEDYESVIRYLAGKGSRPRGLYDCAQAGNLSLAKLLLELGADVNETDRHGRTALDYCTGIAGEREYPEITALLREHGGKNSTAQ